jgi:uncharacterized protein
VVIEFDDAKRAKTLRERGLDFARAGEVFAGRHRTVENPDSSFGETRYITFGYLDFEIVVLVWTPRGEARRIISMRATHEREAKKIRRSLG